MTPLTRPISYKKKSRVGHGSTRGKTSGRGHKGQRARAGHKVRADFLDHMQQIPKRRGYNKNRAKGVWVERVRPRAVPLSRILSVWREHTHSITPKFLTEVGACRNRNGRTPRVKIIGTAKVEKPLRIVGCEITPGARACVEQANGVIVQV